MSMISKITVVQAFTMVAVPTRPLIQSHLTQKLQDRKVDKKVLASEYPPKILSVKAKVKVKSIKVHQQLQGKFLGHHRAWTQIVPTEKHQTCIQTSLISQGTHFTSLIYSAMKRITGTRFRLPDAIATLGETPNKANVFQVPRVHNIRNPI